MTILYVFVLRLENKLRFNQHNFFLSKGPYNHYKGKGKLTGAIVLVLYEDPEDQVPKIVCRCDNYMAWIQEQRMPLHLHVGRDKIIAFDQVRLIFDLANLLHVYWEFYFILL